MAIEDELRERLRKVEALFVGSTTAGEREAASAAAERLKAKLAEASRLDPPVEMWVERGQHRRHRQGEGSSVRPGSWTGARRRKIPLFSNAAVTPA